ncbi:MAG: TldD/PmbA family protein [Candidatus Bathyarchaeia archaeon]
MEQLKDSAERAVDLARTLGAAYAEARVQDDLTNTLVVKNGNVEVGSTDRILGIGIRVILDGSLGFASVNQADKELVRKRVSDALTMAKAAKGISQPVKLSEEKALEGRWEVREKIPFEDISVEDKISLLLDADGFIESVGEARIPARLLEMKEMRTRKYFTNSEGSRISSSVSRVSFEAMITALRGSDSEQGRFEVGEAGGWEAVDRWGITERCAERARVLVRILQEARRAPRGKIDLVLGSEIVGIVVHESAGHPYEADRILGREAAQAGESFVSVDMLGTRIGSDIVNVVDDPTMKGSFGFYKTDEEGVSAKPRFLIKDGGINEFLHNRETASELGVQSNAASRASEYDREPLVRMANTYLLPGDADFQELVEDVKLGVYMKSYMEWNISDLRFNMRFVGSEAYLIKGGELRNMVRRPIIELTTPKFYSKIDAVGKDLEFYPGLCGKGDPVQGVPVWFGGPAVRLTSVRLGGG